MATKSFTSQRGLSDLQDLVIELEKNQPDPKIIKALTTKYGIPYKPTFAEQLDELLIYLNSLSFSAENETTPEA